MEKHTKALGALVVGLLVSAVLIFVGPSYGWWQAGVAVLLIFIIVTIAPIIFSFLNFAELNDPGDWFDEADWVTKSSA